MDALFSNSLNTIPPSAEASLNASRKKTDTSDFLGFQVSKDLHKDFFLFPCFVLFCFSAGGGGGMFGDRGLLGTLEFF